MVLKVIMNYLSTTRIILLRKVLNRLDLDNYSSAAAFFDYDLDGDLDMYLLNHAVHLCGSADVERSKAINYSEMMANLLT
jgi:hypothetical protein